MSQWKLVRSTAPTLRLCEALRPCFRDEADDIILLGALSLCAAQRRGALSPRHTVQRITFTEITKAAVTEAMRNPRQVRAVT